MITTIETSNHLSFLPQSKPQGNFSLPLKLFLLFFKGFTVNLYREDKREVTRAPESQKFYDSVFRALDIIVVLSLLWVALIKALICVFPCGKEGARGLLLCV